MATSFNPTPKTNYLPVILTNNSGLAASEVNVLYEGNYRNAGGDLFFFNLTPASNPPNGVLFPTKVTSPQISTQYSFPLSSLPSCSTGVDDYLIYVPNSPSNRFYFSVDAPIFLQSDVAPNAITAPTYFAFYDPNYSTLFETVEVAYIPDGGTGAPNITWTASVNTTEVDAFGLPMKIQYLSYSPDTPTAKIVLVQNPNALPSGFGAGSPTGSTTRSEIINTITTALTSDDQTGSTPKIWPKLALPFYSDPYTPTGLQTYLRVLSPKQSVGLSPNPLNPGGLTNQHLSAVNGSNATTFFNYNYPPFPINYLTATGYGATEAFAENLFDYYQNGPHSLYISTGGGSATVYQGVVSGTSPNRVFTFTGVSGPNTGQVSTLNENAINTFSLYSGSQLMSGGVDGDLLGFYFGDAFTVGFLPSAIGTLNTGAPPNGPINVTDAVDWQPFYIPDYYIPQYTGFGGGPWDDLYAGLMHASAVQNVVSGDLNGVGLCYGYDFDDSLGISGTITPSSLTPAQDYPLLNIEIGPIDTTIPDPYSDANSYNVTFNFPNSTSTVQYSQNGGAWTNVTQGQVVNGLFSSGTDTLRLHYDNGMGVAKYFTLYLYYQMMQPFMNYDSDVVACINATQLVPNANPPTAFTINLLP